MVEQAPNPSSRGRWLRISRVVSNYSFSVSQAAILVGLVAFLCVTFVVAAMTGAIWLPLFDMIWNADVYQVERTIFLELRMPRVLMAGVVGATLALAGACLQGMFRNPLADPGLLGVASGAALGATSFIVLGSHLPLPEWFVPYALPVAAAIGATIVTIFLYAFTRIQGRMNLVTLLLVGIAINAMGGVGLGLLQYASDDNQLRSLTFWMMGSFGRSTWDAIFPALLLMVPAAYFLLRSVRALDLLQLGDGEARNLGVDVHRVRKSVVFGVAAVVGAGVAIVGMIGFVGLVIPHIVRLLGGPIHRYVIPASALMGASTLILADLISRTIVVPAELPVGLVTAFIGSPCLLWLLLKTRIHT